MKQLTLSQALEGYVLFAEPKLSPHTLQDYFNTFRKFQSFLGEDLLINDIMSNILPASSASTSISRKRPAKLPHGFVSSLDLGIPTKSGRREGSQTYQPPKPDEIAIVPYTETDIKAMLASCQKRKPYLLPGQRETATDFPEGPRLKTSLLLLLDTGIRASEYCGLKIKDVDLRNRNIMVMGKGAKSAKSRSRAEPHKPSGPTSQPDQTC